MTDVNDVRARLNPKIAKHVQMAEDVELIQYPLASIGLTRHLNGGVGAGRITLIYGNSGSGKSLITMQSIGMWQRMGLSSAYIDVEGTYTPQYGERIGISNSDLLYIHKRGATAVTDIACELIDAEINILAIDSVSDLIPDSYLDKDGVTLKSADETNQMGAQAKAITKMINMMQYVNRKTAIILVSQTTTEMGQTYVKQVPHGGKKIFFAATNIIKLTSSNTEAKQLKGEVQVGNRTISQPIGRTVDALVEKSKLGAQHRTSEYNVYYDGPNLGIDRIDELSKIAVDLGITRTAGAWYYWDEINEKFNGEKKFSAWLKENPDMQDKLRQRIEEES